MATIFDAEVLDVGTRKWSTRVGHGALGFNSNSQFDGLSMGPTENFLLPAVANVSELISTYSDVLSPNPFY